MYNNQVGAIEHILNYITKYQNNFVSSYLFESNLGKMIDLGINLTRLFDSKVFTFHYEVDEWPTTHWENTRVLASYNDSIFNLRNNYNSIFVDPVH